MSRRQRIVAVIGLWILAPWTAECSWGGFALGDYPIVVLFLGPLYGGAAVLIREVVRRAGLGWPSIALFGAAFGVFLAGLVDQSLFNQHFLDDTEYAGLIRDSASTLIPGVGVSAGDLLNYVGNHVVLSICAPIAIIESLAGPEGRRQPWLGRWGLGAAAVLFVLGALLIHSDATKGYTAAPHQIVVAVVTIGVLIVAVPVGRALRRRAAWSWPRPGAWSGERRAVGAFWSAVVTAVPMFTTDALPGWAGIALQVVVVAVVVLTVVCWSQRPGWSQRHVLAAFSGPLVAVGAMAYVVPNYAPASPAEAVLGDVAITVVAASLLITAFYRLRHESDRQVARRSARRRTTSR